MTGPARERLLDPRRSRSAAPTRRETGTWPGRVVRFPDPEERATRSERRILECRENRDPDCWQDGRFVLTGSIDRLDGDQYARKEANVELQVVLTDRRTGREVLKRPASANEVAGSVMSLKTGVFASVEELRAVIERALSDSVEAFVDGSAFRDAVK